MLNEEKIRLMTRVTVYEEGRGIEDSRKARFFQNDFVFAEIVGSIFTGTLAWGVCAAIYCGYYFEDIFFSVYENALGPILQRAATTYFAFMAVYLFATFLIYHGRSIAYEKRRMLYEQDLDTLTVIYQKERM